MSELSNLLKRAFENKGNKNHYSSGPFSVGFEDRAYEILFEVYYNCVSVLSGNTFDKEVCLCTSEQVYSYDKLFKAVEEALPEYHFGGELYEKHLQEQNQKDYVNIIENAISAALRDGYDQFVYVDGNGEYAFSRCVYDKPIVPIFEDEKILGKVECFWKNGILQAGYVEYSEDCAEKASLEAQIQSAETKKSDFVPACDNKQKLER